MLKKGLVYNMNKYVRDFLLRGMMFSGLGPIVLGIVYFILSVSIADFSLSGGQVCLAIVSTYLIAFLQAGATVFNQIEAWPISKSLLCHFVTLYVAYVLCYLLNTWIPFKAEVVLVFTVIFVVGYFLVWGIVYAAVTATSKKLNRKLH